ncbi:helix-turn-helix domain-containing protein [Desulfurobacterium thermolithotrophum]|jgi:transcriptional regulator with XRE-family HTH domain|uniref:helix-turn-helix domain-containing protein n=1 Tax=Desulfurobacterium thermolithotrophum TaxID=64160 RepID=UPI0013D68FAA|nr:helix-turn-helix transcriptional regulator [Desulfurobacterium thermolithotrophum]
MDKKIDKKPIGERLKLLRKKYLRLSQEQLAEILGVKRNTLSNWERGENEINYEALSILHKKFGVNTNWLLFGEGSMFTEEKKEKQEEPEAEYIPYTQAGIDKELAIMIAMLSPEQQESLKLIFKEFLKKGGERQSSFCLEKQKERGNVVEDSHDENMIE